MKNPVQQYFRKYPLTTLNGILYATTLGFTAMYATAFVFPRIMESKPQLDRKYAAVTAGAFGLLATSMVMRDLEGY